MTTIATIAANSWSISVGGGHPWQHETPNRDVLTGAFAPSRDPHVSQESEAPR
jgi:hypothetical protein